MIRLVEYEIKKHFLKLPMAAVILLFLIVNVMKISNIYYEKGIFSEENLADFKKVYWECYEEFGGEITNEKIEKLMSIYIPIQEKIADQTLSRKYDADSYTYNAYSDEIFFRWCFVDEIKYDYYYKQYAEELVSNAKNNIELYQSVGNRYKYRENYQTALRFVNREINNFTYTEKYLYYLQYDFSVLLVLLIGIYGLSNVFVLEKETEMDKLLITTVRGGRKSVLAKILASSLFVTVVCFLFWMEDFIAFSAFFDNFGGNSSPLYALEIFKNTPLNIGLLQYALLSGILKTFGMLVFCMIFLLFSSAFKKSLFSYIVSFAIMVALILVHDVVLMQGQALQKILNPVSLLVNREIWKETEFINILGYPIPVCSLTIIVGLLWGALSIIGTAALTEKSRLRKNML